MLQTGLKVIFMGSPDFACQTLSHLIASRHEVIHVLTQPPRAKGRGLATSLTPVGALAQSHNIDVSWPLSLKDEAEVSRLDAMEADLFVVVAYGLILPPSILALPRLGAVNGHASLLPRWRGAAPIQRAIEAGDTHTGTAAMMMEKGLDTGPVIASSQTAITSDDTAQTLHDRLAEMTADTLLGAIDALQNGTATPTPQPDEGVTYAAKIDKAEANLDLSAPARLLKQKIHAFSPFPGSYVTGASGKRLKCLAASASLATKAQSVGTYLGLDDEAGLMVACGDGSVLSLRRLQPAGKTPMSGAEFARGRALQIGDDFKAQI